MSRGCFVTGTDTGVGKTVIACALLHQLCRQGLKAVGMKPVAAGCERTAQGLINEDVELLRAAGVGPLPREAVNVYAFEPPIAPHIAAQREGTHIDLALIARRFEQLCAQSDAVVVEGAGGFLVPLTEQESFADLAVLLALPVVLVVGMRLGCINHALLTAQAIHDRGLRLAGWVANRVDPGMACFEENVESLRARLDAKLLGVVPFLAPPDPAAIRLDLPDAFAPNA
jgi:dethiobiotin synthetase